ncbi:hypothetical protein [Paraburkholderia rhizosphaerae]|uniref:Uncharacterized protein n=1 Tax=Paraburkholderia rhizosphaerae TaxID=480658 RepID=A0A4R8LVI3_9BURK|nr:hypothetical protein [Paraburkholderia rhizosphaerae]TDY51833.1 hypothetical protein BX592_106127 [Paraburkholderia rhizosphaerae]
MSNETKKTSIGRRVAHASFYMIPGYPVYKAFQSAKETASSGAKTLRDLHNELERQRLSTRRTRTYREAIEQVRTADSLPLEQIARKCLNSKRVCLLVAYLCLLYFIYGVVGGDFLAVFNSVFGAMLPLLFTVKYEHRLWQLETGPQRPDEPLGSYRDFFRSRGALLRLANPRLF